MEEVVLELFTAPGGGGPRRGGFDSISTTGTKIDARRTRDLESVGASMIGFPAIRKDNGD